METPELTIQDHPDVDEQIAKRIDSIQRAFGGLGEFFDNLQAEREAQASSNSPIDQLIEEQLAAVARLSKSPSGARS